MKPPRHGGSGGPTPETTRSCLVMRARCCATASIPTPQDASCPLGTLVGTRSRFAAGSLLQASRGANLPVPPCRAVSAPRPCLSPAPRRPARPLRQRTIRPLRPAGAEHAADRTEQPARRPGHHPGLPGPIQGAGRRTAASCPSRTRATLRACRGWHAASSQLRPRRRTMPGSGPAAPAHRPTGPGIAPAR
jgi:hypothetical protein